MLEYERRKDTRKKCIECRKKQEACDALHFLQTPVPLADDEHEEQNNCGDVALSVMTDMSVMTGVSVMTDMPMIELHFPVRRGGSESS